jgi:hypothetical protein
MTAFHLLQAGQEAAMSRVEPKERPAKREAQEGRRQSAERTDRKPSQAEGDERTIDEALRNEDRRT